MAEFKLNVGGLAELSATLNALPEEVAVKLLRGAASTGARIIRDEAKVLAPVDTGEDPREQPELLKDAIHMFNVPEEQTPTRVVFHVRPRSGLREKFRVKGGQAVSLDAFYWRWVEFGHRIVARSGKGAGSLSARRKKALAIKQTVDPKPFLRPAFETRKQAAIDAMRAYLIKNIPIVAARIKR